MILFWISTDFFWQIRNNDRLWDISIINNFTTCKLFLLRFHYHNVNFLFSFLHCINTHKILYTSINRYFFLLLLFFIRTSFLMQKIFIFCIISSLINIVGDVLLNVNYCLIAVVMWSWEWVECKNKHLVSYAVNCRRMRWRRKVIGRYIILCQ